MKITLKAARVNKGYSQTKAAKLLDVSVVTLRDWEFGRKSPTIKKVKDMLRLYDIALEDLIVN